MRPGEGGAAPVTDIELLLAEAATAFKAVTALWQNSFVGLLVTARIFAHYHSLC